MALGLVKKEQASKSAKPKPPYGKKTAARGSGQGSGKYSEKPRPAATTRIAATSATLKSDENISLEQAYRIRENLEKSEKQKQHERKLEEDRRRAALNREIRQIVETGRLNLPDALEARYFMYKERIRKIHVSPEQLRELNEGSLGVVYLAGGYHLLTADGVEAVRKLSPAHVPELLVGEADDEEQELWAAAGAAADEPDDDESDDDESGADPGSEQAAGPETESAEAQVESGESAA